MLHKLLLSSIYFNPSRDTCINAMFFGCMVIIRINSHDKRIESFKYFINTNKPL